MATSPECGGTLGFVLTAGATVGEKCWIWVLLSLPHPVARAGAVADCCRGANLSSFGGASEKRLVSRGRPRGPGPGEELSAFPTSGVRSRAKLWEPFRPWLPVSLAPAASGHRGFWGEPGLQASGPLARRRSAEARLKVLLRDALLLTGT